MVNLYERVSFLSYVNEFRRNSCFFRNLGQTFAHLTCETSQDSVKFLTGHRKIEANFRRSEILTKICAKRNEISAKFRSKAMSAKTRAQWNEKAVKFCKTDKLVLILEKAKEY